MYGECMYAVFKLNINVVPVSSLIRIVSHYEMDYHNRPEYGNFTGHFVHNCRDSQSARYLAELTGVVSKLKETHKMLKHKQIFLLFIYN